MDNLCDLVAGVQINKQHLYFDLAKNDIFKLAQQFANYKEYDSSILSLLTNIKLLDPDLYHLNIVIQYIVTYGDRLFNMCLKDMKVDSYNNMDYEQYLNEYVEELSSYIR